MDWQDQAEVKWWVEHSGLRKEITMQRLLGKRINGMALSVTAGVTTLADRRSRMRGLLLSQNLGDAKAGKRGGKDATWREVFEATYGEPLEAPLPNPSGDGGSRGSAV